MGDGFEAYHVPQQIRRDKLRVNGQGGGCGDGLQACAGLVGPLYDPSLIASDLINCGSLRPQSFNPGGNTSAGVKEEGMNLMNFGGGINSSSTHMYVDPQLSVQLNPSPPTIHDIAVYPHCFRGVAGDQSFHALSMVQQQQQHHHQDTTTNNSTTGQSLSLSLSSHHSSLPLELNLQRYNNSSSSNNNNESPPMFSNHHKVSSVPLGPFTGYASVLKGSRFLKPAQQLLEELCGVGRGFYGDKTSPDHHSSLLDPPPLETSLNPNDIILDDSMNCSDGSDHSRKKSRLLSMLDEVYKRYKQYYQQMQAAVAAFESVAGLSNAAPFANLALKAMSKHFTCLKNAITDQLRFITKSHGKTNSDRDEALRVENSGRGTYGQRPFHGAGFNDQPVWRPQRGLPERAVAVLRAWLFEHFLHPYPTDTDKIMLAKQTGLSRNQVSNWFINARVRLWKPMVEEIHTLEMRETQKSSQRGDNHPQNRPNEHLPTSCSIDSENASSSIHRIGDFHNLKRTHDDNPTDHEARGGSDHTQMKLPYDNLLHGQHMSGSVGLPCTGTGNVSLTLGLHQNGLGLPDSYPINAARRFGLDSQGGGGGEGYIMSGFAAENQQFGRDQIGGHLMHDFVG